MKKIRLIFKVIRTLFSLTFFKQCFDLVTEFVLENVYELKRIHKGQKSSVSSSARFMYGENIYIGSKTNINRNCILWASPNAKIVLGNNCLTGPGVVILTSKYRVKGRDLVRSYPQFEGDVIIEDDVWLGANVIVLPGVKIGQGAIIGSGTVVTKDIEPYSVSVGNRLERLKDR